MQLTFHGSLGLFLLVNQKNNSSDFLIHDSRQNPFTYNYISWNYQNKAGGRDLISAFRHRNLKPVITGESLHFCEASPQFPHLHKTSCVCRNPSPAGLPSSLPGLSHHCILVSNRQGCLTPITVLSSAR